MSNSLLNVINRLQVMKRGAWMVLLVLVCCGCQVFAPALPPPTSPQLLLGNPTPQADQSRYDLLNRPQYALLFDRQTNTAAWASWQLNRNWLGHLERPPFAPDPELSQRGVAVTPSDYTRSGFDRGHLVPAADRNRTAEDSAAVFS
ncbi:MAG TPA: DNA/RNA non-specific endonuclease, partial [Stenomitos sp.]